MTDTRSYAARRLAELTAREPAAYTEAAIDVSAQGAATVIAAQPGTTIRVYKLLLMAGGAVTLTPRSGSTPLTGGLPLQSGGGMVLDGSSSPWFTCGAGEAFVLNLSAAVQVSGRIYYTQE